MKTQKIILRMIPLEEFIDQLIDLYNDGADYIDLHGTHNEEQDTIGIYVQEEYYFTEEESSPLSEDELDNLSI